MDHKITHVLVQHLYIHCKKRLAVFPVHSRDVTNQTLPGREYLNYSPARESLVSDIPAGDGKTANLFLQCIDIYAYARAWEHLTGAGGGGGVGMGGGGGWGGGG